MYAGTKTEAFTTAHVKTIYTTPWRFLVALPKNTVSSGFEERVAEKRLA